MRKYFLTIVIVFYFNSQSMLNANAADMVFKGVLVEPPPCKINEGIDMTLSFDKIGVNKVDGDNYRKEIEYTLSCKDSPSRNLTMMLDTSSVASFSSGTIQSNIAGLGIKVYINGAPAEFSKPLVIKQGEKPKLEAVPVSQPGIDLTEGKFYASATLTFKFQ